jgi:hypothetical protein
MASTNNHIVVVIGDHRIEMVPRKLTAPDAEFNARTRVYIDTSVATARSAQMAELIERSDNLPCDQQIAMTGDFPEVDKLQRKVRRETARIKREIAEEIVGQLIAQSILRPTAETLMFAFSQTAGCSCSCSPGVIVNNTMLHDARPVDIFVNVNQ